MIRRVDGAWLPFWHPMVYVNGALVTDDTRWCVSLTYVDNGRRAIGPTVPSRWRLVALWRGLRGQVR